MHFLDDNGEIPKQIPKEARHLASFLAMVIDATTEAFPTEEHTTMLRCFKKKCDGTIKCQLLSKTDSIHWICTKCNNEGIISDWHGTKWDNIKRIDNKTQLRI